MKLYPCGTKSTSVKNIMEIAKSALSTTKVKPNKITRSSVSVSSRESR